MKACDAGRIYCEVPVAPGCRRLSFTWRTPTRITVLAGNVEAATGMAVIAAAGVVAPEEIMATTPTVEMEEDDSAVST